MDTTSMLQVSNLTVQFGSLKAVNNVSFEIQRGEIFALIGPNGAGKTTAFNAISGLLFPQAGQIVFKGTDITKLMPHKRCKLGMARTFQVVRAFNYMTVEDVVRVGAYNRQGEDTVAAKVDQMIELCGLGEVRQRVCGDLGLATLRRVELARALATEPELLLLDESGAGLNTAELASFMDLLRKINREQNITLCIVEHLMQMVMGLSQRIVVLDSGEVIATGTPHEISNNQKVIEAYLGKRVTQC